MPLIDLRLEDGKRGWTWSKCFAPSAEDARIVVLTGYGAIATAVAAVKIGATDYLSKPADANEVVRALLGTGEALPDISENPMSADRVRWEHIQRVYEQCDRNVSETARRLSMHRRTLPTYSWPNARLADIACGQSRAILRGRVAAGTEMTLLALRGYPQELLPAPKGRCRFCRAYRLPWLAARSWR